MVQSINEGFGEGVKKRMKKKLVTTILGLVLTASLLAGCGGNAASTASSAAPAESKEAENAAQGTDDEAALKESLKGTSLNLYTWDDMFPREILDGFTEEYGVTINYSNFDYDEDMLAKLEETQGADYDLVIADDYILELVNNEGLAMPLDKAKIPNYKNIDTRYLGLFYDKEDVYDVPYGAGVPLIVYDPALTDVKIEGFGDLWDESLKDNVAIIGNYRVIDGFTLEILGETLNCQDLDKIEEAGKLLLDLAPNIRAINDNNTQDLLISGEVAAAFLYTSQVTMALTARPDLVPVYPKEGLGFGTMAMFIPSKASNPDAAHAFINYILDAQNSAKCFEYIGYYNTTKAAEEYISEEMKQFIVLPEGTDSGTAIENISDEASDKHAEIWAAFQNA